ncbi:alpha/beta fold hydrolase [Luteibacter yeojuensis]|nr:alpha/beta hydrolase [Luteibacter yeojuensis]
MQADSKPTIVLVHGAWVDGSGWRPVHDRLIDAGYRVVVAQHPLTSFEADLAAVERIVALQTDPVVLVGHCYGGAIVTAAGNDPKVKALVYIAAHALDEGETPLDNDRRFVNATSHAGKDVRETTDGFLYFEPAMYMEDYAADLDPATARFEANAQVPTALSVFETPATRPAWKDKPSWYMVAGADKVLSPDLERMYARRARSVTVEVPGASHAVYRSRPKDVADLIERAARSVAVGP